MEATLIFNVRAGGARRGDPARLLEALEAAGYRARHWPTENEDDLERLSSVATGLVVVAGGDGSLRAVVRRLLGCPLPISLIPLGTANNIARSLGLYGDPLRLIGGLRTPRSQRFDVGKVSGPWGEDIFLEAFGIGLFAEMLAHYDPQQGKSLPRAVDTLREVATRYEAKRYRLRLDGQEISGRYVALEALNTPATGPRLQFAPDARSDDGLLDVVCVLEPAGVTLVEYTLNLLRGTPGRLPNIRHLRGKKLELLWQEQPLHLDAEVFPRQGTALPDTANRDITVELLPGALELWLPQVA